MKRFWSLYIAACCGLVLSLIAFAHWRLRSPCLPRLDTEHAIAVPHELLSTNAVEIDNLLMSKPDSREAKLREEGLFQQLAVMQRCESLTSGSVRFDIRNRMKQGQEEVVSARIQRGLTPALEKSFESPAIGAKVSCIVAIKLIPLESKAFDVEPLLNDQEGRRLLDEQTEEEWLWRVTAKRKGSFHLVLVVTPEITLPGH